MILFQLQKLREEILVMKRYFVSCKFALESKLLLQVRLVILSTSMSGSISLATSDGHTYLEKISLQ